MQMAKYQENITSLVHYQDILEAGLEVGSGKRLKTSSSHFSRKQFLLVIVKISCCFEPMLCCLWKNVRMKKKKSMTAFYRREFYGNLCCLVKLKAKDNNFLYLTSIMPFKIPPPTTFARSWAKGTLCRNMPSLTFIYRPGKITEFRVNFSESS